MHCLTRSPSRAEQFAARGWQPCLGDVTAEISELPAAKTLLFAVSYDRNAAPTPEEIHVVGLRRLLEQLTELDRVIYISTTGVYGGSCGEWVDETTAPQPGRDSSRACWEAEQLLAAWGKAEGVRTTSLRMGGLYGPERVPFAAKLAAEEPLTGSPEGFLNLIHIDDAARIVVDVADRMDLPALLNVTDGHPVLRGDYYRAAADLLGASSPTYAPPSSSTPTPRSRGQANRRVSSALLREHVKLDLVYPNYRAGLRQALGR